MARLAGCFQRNVQLEGLFVGTRFLMGRALDRFDHSVRPTTI